jgi:hypothetical protein
MTVDSDRRFRRLWLINGVLFLVVLVGAVGAIIYGIVTDRLSDSPEVRAEPRVGDDGQPPAGRAVRYSVPSRIQGSAVQLVEVQHGRAEEARVTMSGAGLYGGYGEGPSVNIIFLDPGATAGRLLLDRPAFIDVVAYPRTKDDSLRRFISYEIVFDDTNRDGTLDREDAAAVYVTDLEGRGLTRASPDGIDVSAQSLMPDGNLMIVGTPVPPKGETADRMPMRAFVFDVARRTTTPLAALDSLASRAGTILRGR